jgi:hypothetical protein
LEIILPIYSDNSYLSSLDCILEKNYPIGLTNMVFNEIGKISQDYFINTMEFGNYTSDLRTFTIIPDTLFKAWK